MTMWAVYDHPKDFPDKYVARLWVLYREPGLKPAPTITVLTADSLDRLREMMPMELVRMERYPEDDPSIVEVWI